MDTDAAEDLLAVLDATESLKDISPLKSVGLHKLSGDRAGQWAMTVNGPWRICFRFKNGDTFDVEITARKLSANKLALALRVPSGRITQILSEKRGVSAETALRLSRYFGNSAQFWMNLQGRYELAVAEREIGSRINVEVRQAA
jgi:addiction module HigA family antidote